MASSAFSFHCMICFEEFDPITNYPVVLPCGHTYVCIECANRLDKCMECREPLVVKIELPSTPSSSQSTGGGGDMKENCITPSRHAYTRRSYSREGKYYQGGQQPQQPPPQKQYVTQRLPLPKNAVLLSLIQASEPARRRHQAETEADLPPVLPSSPSEDEVSRGGVKMSYSENSDPPLNATGTPGSTTTTAANLSVGNAASLSIGNGRYTKPSPLFLDNPSSPVSVQYSTDHHNNPPTSSLILDNTNDDEEHKIRVGTYLEGGPCGTYAVAAKTGLVVYPTLFEHSLREEEDGVSRDVENMVKNSYRNKFFSKSIKSGERKRPGLPRSASCATSAHVRNSFTKRGDEAAEAEITTLAYEVNEDEDENMAVEAQFTPKSEFHENNDINTEDEESLRGEAMSDPGGSIPTSPTILSSLSKGESLKHPLKPQSPPRSTIDSLSLENSNVDPSLSATLKLRRQFSLGSGSPTPGSSDGDFDRTLIRLKYGDRVQVVSMDSRGWVKLARGYGYIRLENDKQLVKVGGTSDKACQIEAMLHELSLERNRLKHEQKKLEHLSAGLMIDLQCSLLTSDDRVIVHAPEGLTPHVSNRMDRQSSNASKDDMEITTKPRTESLTPIRQAPATTTNADTQQPHEIRTVKSHSPGRNYITPPSPPYNQTTPGGSQVNSYAMTPTRVNFRTGLSGHRALSSSHSHPHDFIQPIGPSRSMSNHAGLGSKKSSSLRGRSIY